MEVVHEKNWALLDIGFIQSTREHQCCRKVYILAKDGFIDQEPDFFLCRKFEDGDRRYKKSFRFCPAHFHPTTQKSRIHHVVHQWIRLVDSLQTLVLNSHSTKMGQKIVKYRASWRVREALFARLQTVDADILILSKCKDKA